MDTTLVVQPQVTFSELGAELAQLGWSRGRGTLTAPPIIPGEPEFASWLTGSGEAQISYTFNPVVHLRVLVFYGNDVVSLREKVESVLPTLDSSDLRELLRSGEPRNVLLGILAARELKVTSVLDLLGPLTNHSEPVVARAAQDTLAELIQLSVETGLEHLRAEKQKHPERSVLFANLPDARLRRQTVRWLIRDRQESNQHIDEVLRSGLVDDDWEVRVSAMLAAVRLNANAVVEEVSRMTLPLSDREGPAEPDRSILKLAHRLALNHLAGNSIGTENDEQRHLWACMSGRPAERYDRVFLLINALSEPLEVEGEDPLELAYIEECDAGWRLRQTEIEICWVPPLSHWLGSDDLDLTFPNPIRRVTLSAGFFIAQRPLTVSQAKSLGLGLRASSDQPRDQAYLCDLLEAEQLCAALSRRESADITLPEPDEWEMAVRGTDGRRYPWGNGVEGDPQNLLSPWGLEQTVGCKSQWTEMRTDANMGIVCGTEKDLRCFSRHEVALSNPASLFVARPVVRVSALQFT